QHRQTYRATRACVREDRDIFVPREESEGVADSSEGNKEPGSNGRFMKLPIRPLFHPGSTGSDHSPSLPSRAFCFCADCYLLFAMQAGCGGDLACTPNHARKGFLIRGLAHGSLGAEVNSMILLKLARWERLRPQRQLSDTSDARVYRRT